MLNLVKLKGLYPHEWMRDFQKFKEQLPSKDNIHSQLTDRKIADK